MDAIDVDANPMVNRNGGVFVIAVSLSDKEHAQRDRVVPAIFAYPSLLRHQEIQRHYFDEIAHALDQYFRFPVMTRNMDYIAWMVNYMLRVPVQHVMDASYLADHYDPAGIGARLDAMKPQHARVWFISPDAPHEKTTHFVDTPYEVSKMMLVQIARWRYLARAITLYHQRFQFDPQRESSRTPWDPNRRVGATVAVCAERRVRRRAARGYYLEFSKSRGHGQCM